VNYSGSNEAFSFLPLALLGGVGVFFGLAAVVGIFVVVVVANRAEPDPSGKRPLAVYLFGVSFFAVFVALFASFSIVLGLVQLIGSHPGGYGFSGGSQHPIGDAVAREVVLSLLVFLAAIGLLFTHLRSGLSLPEWTQGQRSPIERVVRSYVASVSFVTVFIVTGSVVALIYEVFRILGPGVFELSGTRVEASRLLIATMYLAFAAATVLYSHVRMLPAGGSAWPGWLGTPPSVPRAPYPSAQPPPPPAPPYPSTPPQASPAGPYPPPPSQVPPPPPAPPYPSTPIHSPPSGRPSSVPPFSM
jgi:hypothetical protein